ncbi:MAG TPA: VWA domain-containing protein [Thermoflexales bacterium]|nr:VWA domain-containing protein [Thermoflexales bacterium]
MLAFSQPAFLVLMALLPISVFIAWPRLVRRASGRLPSSVSRPTLNRRVLMGLLVRLLLLTCIIFALAGMQIVTFNNKLSVAFLVDASDSVGATGRERAMAFVREAARSMRVDGNDQTAVIVFGDDAQVDRSLSAMRDVADPGVQIRSGGTNIESAIRLGLSVLPNDTARRLVLLSDGRQTAGDAQSAARLAKATGARLDVVTLPGVDGPDAAIERVDAPTRASIGQVIPLNVVVRSNVAQKAQLTVFSGADVASQSVVNLNAGQNEFVVKVNAAQAGFGAFRAQIVPERDAIPQNNTLAAPVIVGGAQRVLLVAQNPAETASLKPALAAAGLEFDEVTPAAMPAEIQSLASYQAVVMANVPARDLSDRTMLSIQSYVRDTGGGLAVIGGPNSYGVGGYFKTPLEETLPVEMQVKDPRRFPSVAMVVVMDKSGSMSVTENGVVKIRLAAEAAARVAELMNDQDELTVIGFDTQPVDVIGPFLGRDKSTSIPKILRMGPGGGGIYIFESLSEARKILSASDKQNKFVILLADGSDSERQEGARELVTQMRAEGIQLSVVSIGIGEDVPFLQTIAKLGEGRFHLTTRASNLPSIFTEEAALAQRNYIVEQPFFPSQGAISPILSEINAVPQLQGYVASSAKPAAQVVLKANETDPLLATWQYGLGRAVAFTSDATNRWAANWVTWPDFARFWAQAIRWTILERKDSPIQARVITRGGQSVIAATAPDTAAPDAGSSAVLTATILNSEGVSQTVTLAQTAPGEYEATAQMDAPGAYFVRVTGSAGDEAVISWARPYSQEYAPQVAAAPDMRAWAQAGGGAELSAPAQAFALNMPLAASRQELFPFLLALAALLLPFDVAVRRIAVGLRRAAAKVAAAPAPASGGTLEGLLKAKQRANARGAGDAVAPAEHAQPTLAQTIAKAQKAQEGEKKDAPPQAPSAPSGTAAELLKRKREKKE